MAPIPLHKAPGAELTRSSPLRDVVRLWGESLQTRVRRGELGARTAQTYRRDVALAEPLFAIPIGRLRRGHVKAWIDALEPLGHDGEPSSNLAFEALAKLRRCLTWAETRELLDHNPAAGLSWKVRRAEGQALSLEQVAHFVVALAAVDDQRQRFDRARHMPEFYLEGLRGPAVCVLLLLLTGARMYELRLAMVSDVDLAAGRIVRARGKNGHRRTIVLGGVAQQLVAEQLERARRVGSDWLFPSPKNPERCCVSKTAVWNVCKAALARARIPARRVHDLRHTCATTLQQLGEGRETIQWVLGHLNPRSTDRYLHGEDEPGVRGAIDRYELAVGGPRG